MYKKSSPLSSLIEKCDTVSMSEIECEHTSTEGCVQHQVWSLIFLASYKWSCEQHSYSNQSTRRPIVAQKLADMETGMSQIYLMRWMDCTSFTSYLNDQSVNPSKQQIRNRNILYIYIYYLHLWYTSDDTVCTICSSTFAVQVGIKTMAYCHKHR